MILSSNMCLSQHNDKHGNASKNCYFVLKCNMIFFLFWKIPVFLNMFFVVSFFAWLFPSTCHGLSRHNNKLGEKVSYDSNEMEDKARCLIWIHRKTVLTVVKFHKLLFLENHCISEHILLFFLCLHGFPSTCLCLICCNGNHDENVHVTAIKSNLNVLCMNPSTNYSLH